MHYSGLKLPTPSILYLGLKKHLVIFLPTVNNLIKTQELRINQMSKAQCSL